MARKARTKQTAGSLKINFDKKGGVRGFEIKGQAADNFFKGLMKAYEDKTEKKVKAPDLPIHSHDADETCTEVCPQWRKN